MDLYQSYSLFSFLVRSNAVALYVSQGTKRLGRWVEGEGKNVSFEAANWRSVREWPAVSGDLVDMRFYQNHGALFQEGVMKT